MRQPKQKLKTEEAFWHCMSLVLGLGTLTMPYVLKLLGWFGVLILALLAWLSAHTAKLLCKCIEYNSGNFKIKSLETYSDIGEAAFGSQGKIFVDCVLYTDLVASSALFLIFISTNMHVLFGEYVPFDQTTWTFILAATLFPTVHLKLSKLSILSKVGSYIMILLVLGIIYAAITVPQANIENNKYNLFLLEFSAIGNMVFAFSCHGTLLTIYREMAEPSKADGLFDKVYATGFLLKLTVGVAGYLMFANDVSDQISLNLPTTVLKVGVTLFVTLKKWLTYALPLEPVAQGVTNMLTKDIKSSGKRRTISFTVRSTLVALTVVIALLLPYFGLFQSIVGALCAGCLVLLFPILFYLKLYGDRLSRNEYLAHVLLFFLSVQLVLLSSYYALLKAKNTLLVDENTEVV